VILLSKAAVYLAASGLATRDTRSRILMGQLAGNPFPDATPPFIEATSRALSLGLAAPIDVQAPFATRHKEDVIRLGVELGVPLELTVSCMHPSAGRHCGQCSKCRERRDAFREAGVEDRTIYAARPPR
jgi:7-cyano-7-deazaguanine synthase